MYTRSAERSRASLKVTAEPLWLLMDHHPWMDPFAGEEIPHPVTADMSAANSSDRRCDSNQRCGTAITLTIQALSLTSHTPPSSQQRQGGVSSSGSFAVQGRDRNSRAHHGRAV